MSISYTGICLLCSFVYGVNSLQNPGQYFIKPLLREFEFSPSSKVLEPHMYTYINTYYVLYMLYHI